jgi:hypothetical protein
VLLEPANVRFAPGADVLVMPVFEPKRHHKYAMLASVVRFAEDRGRMRRRDFVLALGAATAAWPTALAQRATVPLTAYLDSSGVSNSASGYRTAFIFLNRTVLPSASLVAT